LADCAGGGSARKRIRAARFRTLRLFAVSGVPDFEGMGMRSFSLTVLGLDISFRAEADIGRVESAKVLVEERFEKLKFHGGRIGKEALLTFLVLGLADDLLQSHRQMADVQNRIDALLTKIEEV
jgi:cell division protein ZapA